MQSSSRLFVLFFLSLSLAIPTPPVATAQDVASDVVAAEAPPAAVTPSDYGRFESLGPGRAVSRDGAWVAVPIRREDGTSELQLHSLADPDAVVEEALRLEQGRAPAFSADSQWLVYQIAVADAERERMQRDKEPVRNGAGMVRLGEREPTVVEAVMRFTLSGSGRYLLMQRYADEGQEAATIVVRELDSGRDMLFGNVSAHAWQDEGDLLAFTVQTPDGIGNGVQLYDPTSGSLRVLDSGDAVFAGISWRDESSDLAYLHEVEQEDWDATTQRVVGWRALDTGGTRFELDPAGRSDLEASLGLTSYSAPDWSEDGTRLFVVVQEREATVAEEPGEGDSPRGEEPTEPTADAESGGEAEGPEGAATESAAGPATPEADVQVWHSQDERIIPMQQVSENRDRERGLLTVWDLDADRVLVLGTDPRERTERLAGDRYVLESDRSAYRFDNQFDSPALDYWLIDASSGERRKVLDGVVFYEGGSPGGRYLLFFADGVWSAYDVQEGRTIDLTSALPAQFTNTEYDTPTKRGRPPWGAAGWLEGDEAVLLYDRYDVWAVRPSGVGALRLTEGAEDRIRHRVSHVDGRSFFARVNDPLESEALWMSLYGETTKRSGYARVSLGGDSPATSAGGGVDRLLFADAALGGLLQAEDADRFIWVQERYDDSPDVFTGDGDLAVARQVTETNVAQQSFLWGRSELVEYESSFGEQLQGALYYPAGYEAGKTYPMIVYVYEKLSQGLHRYAVPSERSPYNTAVFSAEGYFVLRPDIVFQDREPGISATDCITAAVQAVLDTGMVDPDRIGLVGHSWGGYEAAFVPTQTDIFAASVAGAPLTNFFSMFGTIHWNQGMPETQHFETGQGRMEVPYWEDMAAYVRNSPVMHITNLETPMLIFFGDSDGTVDWHQGVEMYNYARRAGKFLVMLVYPGENHSARRRENQIDYHHRVLQWFGHFLKGEEAETWITEGEPVVQ